MGKNTITDELIEKKMIAKGYGEDNSDEKIRESVLNHYEIELTTDFNSWYDFYIYEESTVDGYTVYICTDDPKNININENVHYYDHSLFEELVEVIKHSNGGEIIYVDDLYQDYIIDVMQELYEYLWQRFHEESIDELLDEGYEEEMIADLISKKI